METEKISTSSSTKSWLVIVFIVLWALIQLLITFIFSEPYFFPGTLLFLVILFFLIETITGNVQMNQAGILLNAFSKKSRAVFEGFYFRLPWEQVSYKIDLEATIDSNINETFTTNDGKLSVTASIMSKPNPGIGEKETERSLRMVKYVRFSKDAQKGMQEAEAKKIMREVFKNKSSKDGKDLKSDQILKLTDFKELEDLLSVKVLKCPVTDIDYDKEVQNARDAVAKAQALGDMKKALVKSGYTNDEAKAIAPLLDKDINLKKQINDVNFNGLSMPPELLKAISSLISKFGGK
jgi:regulator of protease activity HflC (stomatin/prohibitin superfamily)